MITKKSFPYIVFLLSIKIWKTPHTVWLASLQQSLAQPKYQGFINRNYFMILSKEVIWKIGYLWTFDTILWSNMSRETIWKDILKCESMRCHLLKKLFFPHRFIPSLISVNIKVKWQFFQKETLPFWWSLPAGTQGNIIALLSSRDRKMHLATLSTFPSSVFSYCNCSICFVTFLS